MADSALNGLYRYEFEKPIAELERRLHELRKGHSEPSDVRGVETQLEQLKQHVYAHLTAWQRVQLARHPLRPYTLDYIALILHNFLELHGDRLFGDDKAMVGGFAQLEGRAVLVIGHQKGRDTKQNLMRNFGSAHPEGYRKALRLLRLAEKRRVPVVVLIDTPGAYPGIGAEERGQAHSIAYNMREMARIRTPIFLCVIGEGGSGGAHHDPARVAQRIKDALVRFLASVEGLPADELLRRRYERFRRIGVFTTDTPASPTPTSS